MKRQHLLWLYICLGLTVGAKRAFGLAESTGPGGSNAQAVHALGEKGDGIKIGLMGNKNLYVNHEAFKDQNGLTHAFNYDVTGSGISPFDHDTWMAGIAVSRGGANYPNDIGVAPEADIHCVRVVSDEGKVLIEEGLDKLIVDLGCDVLTSAFALGGNPNGSSDATLMYDYYAFKYDVVIINPAGNEASEVNIPGDAYNGITTGGLIDANSGIYTQVGSISNPGPTADSRNKPDVTAPSSFQTVPHSGTNIWRTPPFNAGHTSLSVPHTTGVAALLLGLAEDTAEEDDHHNEVIRAVIVNSAFPNIKDKAGQSTSPASNDPNKFWNADRGYGRVDALRAYQLLSSPRLSAGAVITQQKGWAYNTLGDSQTHTYLIQAQKNQRLVLTVTWNREPTRKWRGTYVYSDEDPPKFNIDLTVKDPNGDTIFDEDDSLNNLEKVDLLLPKDGEYEIILNNTTNKQRDYGLAFELIEPLTADFNLDYIVDMNDLYVLSVNWLQEGLETDVTGEAYTNFKDYSVLAKNIGLTNPAYH